MDCADGGDRTVSNLKPCPFCGRIPSVEDCGSNRWFVKCGCGIAQDKLYHQRCDAVKAWNRRKTAQPEIIMCKDCKHNPKDTWFECPMSHLSEKQRPETAWCWKGERRQDA